MFTLYSHLIFSRQKKNYLKNCIFNSREKFSNAFFFNFRAIQIQIDGKNNAEFAVFFSGPIFKLPTKIAQKEGKALKKILPRFVLHMPLEVFPNSSASTVYRQFLLCVKKIIKLHCCWVSQFRF